MNEIDKICLKAGESAKIYNWTSLNEGATFDVPKGDNGIVLMVKAYEGGSVYVRKGDGPMAGKDKVLSLSTDDVLLFYLESGRYMQTEGENRGKIVVDSEGYSMSACVLQLI